MKLELTWEQQALEDSVRKILQGVKVPIKATELEAQPNGYDEGLWKQFIEAGFTGLLENNSFTELVVLHEQLGYFRAQLPLITSCVTGLGLLRLLKSQPEAAAIAGKVSAGDAIIAPALWGGGKDTASPQKGVIRKNGKITGKKLLVPFFDCARWLVVLVDSDPLQLCLVEAKAAGIRGVKPDNLAVENAWTVEFSDTPVLLSAEISKPQLDKALLPSAMAITALSAGAAKKALDMTMEWVNMREAFGHKLASFQVLQHYLTNIAMDTAATRHLAYYGAWSLAHDEENAARIVASGKLFAGESFERIAGISLRMFGGHGFLEDSGMPLFFRRAKAWQLSMGGHQFWRDVLAQASGLRWSATDGK